MQDMVAVRKTRATAPSQAVPARKAAASSPVLFATTPSKPAVPVPQEAAATQLPRLSETALELTPAAPKTRRRSKTSRRRRPSARTAALYTAATLVFAFGIYVGVTGMLANKQVDAQVKTLQKTVSGTAGGGNTAGAPSSEKPSSSSIANYVVAPGNPRYIDIPKLGVHARVLSMGVDKDNVLESPRGIYDAGWYNASAKPGEQGAMLVDGHSGIGKTHGIFHFLSKLTGGDSITITRGDGQKYTYVVVKTAVLNTGDVDMASMMVSQDPTKPGLNLITCTGDWIPGTTSLKQRALVYAVLQ